MNQKQAICVYCASSSLIDQAYINVAFTLGKLIVSAGKHVVCGAGCTGLMGALIDGAITQKGQVIGVIPQFMVENGWHHSQLTKMEVTNNMHERKKRMAELSSAVIALPGGCGTMEELLEIITWRQLGLYSGNIVILNISGYYDSLLQMLNNAISQGFMKIDHSHLWQVATTPEEAIEMAIKQDNNNFSPKY